MATVVLTFLFVCKVDGVPAHLTASISAGFIATVVSSPADVIKSRVMSQPIDAQGQGTLYRSTFDCASQAIRAEGVLSLWNGFIPNFARLAPHCVIVFVVLEQLRSRFPG